MEEPKSDAMGEPIVQEVGLDIVTSTCGMGSSSSSTRATTDAKAMKSSSMTEARMVFYEQKGKEVGNTSRTKSHEGHEVKCLVSDLEGHEGHEESKEVGNTFPLK